MLCQCCNNGAALKVSSPRSFLATASVVLVESVWDPMTSRS